MTNDLLVSFKLLDNLHEGILRPLRITFFLMSYFNSCTNPIVYAFMSRHFRNTFKYTLFLLCRKYTIVHHQKQQAKYSCETRSMSFHTGKILNVVNDNFDKDKVSNGYNVCVRNSGGTSSDKRYSTKYELELTDLNSKRKVTIDSNV